MKAKVKFRVAVLVAGLVAVAMVYTVGFTSRGTVVLAQEYFSRLAGAGSLTIGSARGSLVSGAVFKDIRMRGMFPRTKIPVEGMIPLVTIDPVSLLFPHLHLRVIDGKLVMPGAQTLRFYGDYGYPQVNLSVYSTWFSLAAVLRLYPPLESLRFLEGMLADIDLTVSSRVYAPHLRGSFTIEEGSFKGFVVKHVPCTVDLRAQKSGMKWQVFGHITYRSGVLLAQRIRINLEEGSLAFNGDPAMPTLALKGDSTVGDTLIRIKLTGTLAAPSLTLSSSPPMPQDRLMALLVTATPWRGMDETVSKGQLTPDLVKDFIDYLLLGGTSAELSQQLGVKDISLQYDDVMQGVTIKKSLTDSTQLRYGVMQYRQSGVGQKEGFSQNVAIEHKLSDSLSIEGASEVSSVTGVTSDAPLSKDSKFEVKMKKSF